MRLNGMGMTMWAGLILAGGLGAQERPEARLPAIPPALAEAAWDGEVQDPADELYRQARRSLASESYQEAARLFLELRERYPRSTYTGDAYYFEALARYREGASRNLARARGLLREQAELFPDAATRADARSLEARITAAAARRGDAEAAARVREQAARRCEDEEMAVRSTALAALLNMDSERAVPILREVLQERDECAAELRRQAIFLLAQHMTDETVDVLVDLALRNPDPDPEVREVAVFWLSQAGDDPAARDALMEILESGEGNEAMQEKALFAIAQSGDPEARAILESYARRSDAPPQMREHAIFWLGQTGGSLQVMMEIYGSLDDPELKERVLFGIAQSQDPQASAWLLERALDDSESIEVRRAALFWAGQSGVAPAQVVRIYRTSQDRELKEHAIMVLSQVGEEDRTAAVDAMMEIARTETDPELKERVVFWLGQSDDPRVADFLLELIRGGG